MRVCEWKKDRVAGRAALKYCSGLGGLVSGLKGRTKPAIRSAFQLRPDAALDDRGLRLSSYVEQGRHKRHARNPVHRYCPFFPITMAPRLAFRSKRMKTRSGCCAMLLAIGSSRDVAAEAKVTITPPGANARSLRPRFAWGAGGRHRAG
jgi:hypothetical protein